MSAPTFRSCALLLYRGGVRLSHNTTPFTARTVSTIAAAAAAAATANRSPRISACPLASPSPSPSPPQQQKRRSSFMSVDKAPAPEMVPRTKVTMSALQGMYSRGEPITMVTAHDYPSALAAEATGIDVVLVGDSLAMVALGMDSTTEIDVDEMLAHCRAVTRAARNSFVVSVERKNQLRGGVGWGGVHRCRATRETFPHPHPFSILFSTFFPRYSPRGILFINARLTSETRWPICPWAHTRSRPKRASRLPSGSSRRAAPMP